MDVKVSLNNAELAALEVALARANSVQLDGIHMKQLVQMRYRAVEGGTPVDTGELRLSAMVTDDEMGYTKEYAPHVEYGHRTINNGWVHGQRFLQANVDEQRMIYFMDLQKELREKIR